MSDLSYPIGKFQPERNISAERRAQWIQVLAETPRDLREAIAGLTDPQLDTPYRPGGWTVRQVVHHLPDSHMNSYTRMKLCVTEDMPTIKPYDQDGWAALGDSLRAPVDISLDLLDALHRRWTAFLRTLDNGHFKRKFLHPELGEMRLDVTLGLYAWHSRHHIAHVTSLRQRMGW